MQLVFLGGACAWVGSLWATRAEMITDRYRSQGEFKAENRRDRQVLLARTCGAFGLVLGSGMLLYGLVERLG